MFGVSRPLFQQEMNKIKVWVKSRFIIVEGKGLVTKVIYYKTERGFLKYVVHNNGVKHRLFCPVSINQ